MYKTTETVTRIKETAKKKGIKISDMLLQCDLNVNTLSSMNNRGSWVQANSLAKIADCLDVSVDYLLGRTGTPDIDSTDRIQTEFFKIFQKLPFEEQVNLMNIAIQKVG